MQIAILTFEGFNELDSLIAFGILNRIKKPDWRVSMASPTTHVHHRCGVRAVGLGHPICLPPGQKAKHPLEIFLAVALA